MLDRPTIVTMLRRVGATKLLVITSILLGACGTTTAQVERLEPSAASSNTITQEPTQAPEAAAVAQPSPTPTSTPATPTPPEPTREPALSLVDDFETEREAALDALESEQTIQVENRITNRFPMFEDYSTRFEVVIDRAADLSSLHVKLTGQTWAELAPAIFGADPNEFRTRAPSLDFIFAGPLLYLTSEPLNQSADPAVPWSAVNPRSTAANRTPALSFVLEPQFFVDGLSYLLVTSTPVAVFDRELSDLPLRKFQTSIPNAETYSLLPAINLDALRDYDIDLDDLTGESSVWFHFQEGRVVFVELNYGSLLRELRANGVDETAMPETLTDQYDITYFDNETIEVPDADLVEFEEVELPSAIAPPLLSANECYRSQDQDFFSAIPVPCDGPHGFEVFAVPLFDVPLGADFPGEGAMFEQTAEICLAEFGVATGVHGALAALDIRLFWPDEFTWQLGDREATCFVTYPEAVSVPLSELDPMRAFGDVSAYGLEVGDCLNSTADFEIPSRLVDCERSHFYEVFLTTTEAATIFPGASELSRQAEMLCIDAFFKATGERYASSEWTIIPLSPSADSWAVGDREITCVITRFEDVRGSAIISGS